MPCEIVWFHAHALGAFCAVLNSSLTLISCCNQFSRHGRWADPYPGISPTFWQRRDVLLQEQKCSKHWFHILQQTWMLWALTCLSSVNSHELSTYLRMECNFFTCFLELVQPLPPLVSGNWLSPHSFTTLNFSPHFLAVAWYPLLAHPDLSLLIATHYVADSTVLLLSLAVNGL